uniref:4-dimethylallyltryptophan N-methyltransferase n=1 Tax=Clavicipitaceae sp. US2005a TaxID=314575 RepID=A8CVF8_9HYPO|nr:putative ergot alkaloid biosynthetic protein B [Clavicipitaceae sp. US2005a]
MAAPSVIDIRSHLVEDSLPDQVVKGLGSDPKTLPALLFYSNEGLEYWNHHARQPDFYPRHQEIEVLKRKGDEIARSVAPNSVILDLGSANLEKVTYLLEALEAQAKNVTYFALDLSAPQLMSTLKAIPTTKFRHVRFAGLHGTFVDGLRWISETPDIRDLPHCVLLFGLTIGNFSRPNAATFLRNIASQALRGASEDKSSIFLSLDSCKVPTQILRAYTSDGVVPFALQSLAYAKTLFCEQTQNDFNEKPSSCHLNPDDWHYHSEWNFVLGRHEASLIPRLNDIHLGPLLHDIVVKKDEKVRFGCSHKYDDLERDKLFVDAGVKDEMAWTNEGCGYCNL